VKRGALPRLRKGLVISPAQRKGGHFLSSFFELTLGCLYILVTFEQWRKLRIMANIDAEEQQYQQEVEEVKKWWSDSRWRYTRRPFTAEQIVQKRGTLRLQYPSNAQAKKLWDIVEGRFKVSHFLPSVLILANRTRTTM
jgi:hypothetical protein